MRFIFCSILFCFLLLPGLGSGQGIISEEKVINNGERSEPRYEKKHSAYLINQGFEIKLAFYDTIRTFKDRFKVSDWYRIKNVDYFLRKNVSKFEVFDSSGILCYSAELSKSGEILKEGVAGEYYFTITSFNRNEKKFEKCIQYYIGNNLMRYDSIFHNFFEHSKKKQKIMGNAEATISYRRGRLINERNNYYNNKFLNEVWQFNFPVYKLDKPRQQHKPGKPFVYLQDKLKTNYIDSQFYCHKSIVFNLSFTIDNKEQNQHAAFKTSFMKKYTDSLTHKYQFTELINIDRDNFQEFGDYFPFGELMYPREVRNYFETADNRTTTLQYNSRKLVDTIYWNYYFKETGSHCFKALEESNKFYLNGYSGIPVKKVLFTFRYEYFDQ